MTRKLSEQLFVESGSCAQTEPSDSADLAAIFRTTLPRAADDLLVAAAITFVTAGVYLNAIRDPNFIVLPLFAYDAHMSEGQHDAMPDDEWHTFVYVYLTATCCTHCELVPNLMWAWEDLPAGADHGEPAARAFAIRAVPYLKSNGWKIVEGFPNCPSCVESRFPKIVDSAD